MPYQVSWYIESYIIETRLQGEMTEQSMRSMSKTIDELLAAGESPMILLIDMQEVKELPRHFINLASSIAANPIMTHLPAGIWIISENPLQKFFGVLASKATGVPMRAFKTRVQVETFITHTMPELAPLLPTHE